MEGSVAIFVCSGKMILEELRTEIVKAQLNVSFHVFYPPFFAKSSQ